MSSPSFIERQFPVSRLSKESYKERKANHGQTLTGLGKWWGRKPLVLVRATILGLLMPASDDPKKDREIFLKLMTMDEEALRRRRTKSLSQQELYDALDPAARKKLFALEPDGKARWKAGVGKGDKEAAQDQAFALLSYDAKLALCDRPEHLNGPSEAAWREINAHLGTKATSLTELVKELGERRFGHVPRVGDAFCGGGSIPFEAARIGCDAYGSDLNPVAALLTWATLNIVGGGPEVAQRVQEAQKRVLEAVDRQVTEWGIEHDAEGRRADAFLYCVEVKCPECGWMVPMAPSWVIGEKSRAIAVLVPDEKHKRFDILVQQGVSDVAVKKAKAAGTAREGLCCPSPVCMGRVVSMQMLRGDRRIAGETRYGLRLWENEDLVPRPDDLFQERLYCIRWADKDGSRLYAPPSPQDLKREQKVLRLLGERFASWQRAGFIPSGDFETGKETDDPIRTRGWRFWHQLFHPRQLLIHGLLQEKAARDITDPLEFAACLLGIIRAANYDSRLSSWSPGTGKELVNDAFQSAALHTLFNYASRPVLSLGSAYVISASADKVHGHGIAEVRDVRSVSYRANYWVTDPPYADSVVYHELGDFFGAWLDKLHKRVLPEWSWESRHALAITGDDAGFRTGMVDAYTNLTAHMDEDGQQVVMFTHQDVAVWADLALILWSAGLRVTAAWCIATETASALKIGNFVQGTVLLVLRKQSGEGSTFIDDLYPEVEDEVRHQLDSLLALDDRDEPNFGDADLQLAAYAAALRVLTRYKRIEDLDVAAELRKMRPKGDKSPIERIIDQAVRVATDFLVPRTFEAAVWKRLCPEERLYLKGLELEAAGEQRSGVYQELARGFGVEEYRMLLGSGQANATRLKTASEFASRELGDSAFGRSLVRAALFSVYETKRSDDTRGARQWLRNEFPDFWDRRTHLLAVLEYLASLGHRIPHWQQDAHAAELLAAAVRNENV